MPRQPMTRYELARLDSLLSMLAEETIADVDAGTSWLDVDNVDSVHQLVTYFR